MNPYILLAFVVALVASFIGGFTRGAYVQKQADQVVSLTKAAGGLKLEVAASERALNSQKMFAENALRLSSSAAERAGKTDEIISLLAEERDEYAQKLPSQKTKCPLTQSDVRGLRAIGAPARRPVPLHPAHP